MRNLAQVSGDTFSHMSNSETATQPNQWPRNNSAGCRYLLWIPEVMLDIVLPIFQSQLEQHNGCVNALRAASNISIFSSSHCPPSEAKSKSPTKCWTFMNLIVSLSRMNLGIAILLTSPHRQLFHAFPNSNTFPRLFLVCGCPPSSGLVPASYRWVITDYRMAFFHHTYVSKLIQFGLTDDAFNWSSHHDPPLVSRCMNIHYSLTDALHWLQVHFLPTVHLLLNYHISHGKPLL